MAGKSDLTPFSAEKMNETFPRASRSDTSTRYIFRAFRQNVGVCGFTRRLTMRSRLVGSLALVTCVALATTVTLAGDIKSGPDKKTGGPFDVKAITGEMKGKTLCYV